MSLTSRSLFLTLLFATTAFAASAPAKTKAPPIGPVKPPPDGCISMTFFAPGDDSRVIRNDKGRLDYIISSTGKKEPIIAHVEVQEMDDLVQRIDTIVHNDDVYGLSHVPAYFAGGEIPGPTAWAYVRQYLQPGDQIWTYGDNERGMLVVRDNHLFCLLVCPEPFNGNPY